MPLQSWQKTKMPSRWIVHQREPKAFLESIVEMTCKAVNVPVSMISVVTEDRHDIRFSYGFRSSWFNSDEIPMSHSFCKHVTAMGRPLVVRDALAHPLVRNSPAVSDLGLVAYLGEPLHDHSGKSVGCFSVFDHRARDWSENQRRMISINAMLVEKALNWPDGVSDMPVN